MNAQPANTQQPWSHTLSDPDGVLEPELWPSLQQALDRATTSLWATRPWQIFTADGRLSAARHENMDGGSCLPPAL